MHIKKLISRKPYETKIFQLRRHWLILFKRIISWAFLAAIPYGVYRFLDVNFPEILTHHIGQPALMMGVVMYELAMWLLFFTMFIDYELDLWVVTNDRLISMEQHGLFARTVSELDLWRIQDASSDVRGVFQTLFEYGNVHVQTAGATERFVLEQVPEPFEVRKIILEMAELDREFHKRDDAEIMKIATTA
ncbi:MAG: PH domain-containing protein [Candidatus Uhrbacteria bacterium]